MEELLALRSLVLANETSAEEFQGLIQSSKGELDIQGQDFHHDNASGLVRELSDHPHVERPTRRADTEVATTNPQLLSRTSQESRQADTRAGGTACEERVLPDYGNMSHNHGPVDSTTDSTSVLQPLFLAQTVFPVVQAVSDDSSKLATKYAKLWDDVDQLEFALRKVETAKWEHERIEEKLLFKIEEENEEKIQKK